MKTRSDLWRLIGGYKVILSAQAEPVDNRWLAVVQRVIQCSDGAWYVYELRLTGVLFATRGAALRRAYRYIEQHHLRAREGWQCLAKPVNDENPAGIPAIPKEVREVHPGFLYDTHRLPNPEDNRLTRGFQMVPRAAAGGDDKAKVDEWFGSDGDM